MAWVWLVVLGVCAHTIYLSLRVGMARGKFGVEAPATSGHAEFDRYFRAHINSIEQHVIFFPLLAACAYSGAVTIAAILGAAYLLGRILYAEGYVREAKKRAPGMAIGFLAMIGLLLVSGFNLINAVI